MTDLHFTNCEVCGRSWSTRDDFLCDSEVVPIGYQANFVALDRGLFLFNHSCQGTMSLEVHVFADMYDGPIYRERLLGGDSCADYCLHSNLLRPCPNECECAYVREILQRLKGLSKQEA